MTRQVNTQRGIRAALSEAQVQHIRAALTPDARTESVRLLARIYNVTARTIRRVVKGETWHNVA